MVPPLSTGCGGVWDWAWWRAPLDGAKAEEGRQPSLAERLSVVLKTAASAQEGRGFLWWPIALTLGIWAYLRFPSEPARPWLQHLPASVSCCSGWAARRRHSSSSAWWRWASCWPRPGPNGWGACAPVNHRRGEGHRTGGQCVDDAARRRLTIILDVESVEGLPPEGTPRRLRLSSLAKLGEPAIGHRIAVTARLIAAAQAGGARRLRLWRALWLDGRGRHWADREAHCRTRGHNVMDSAGKCPAARYPEGGWQPRIRAVLGPPYDAFADALITGERASIPGEVNQSLLASDSSTFSRFPACTCGWWWAGVFWAIRATLGADSGTGAALPDQEMGRRPRPRHGLFLPAAGGFRGRHPALLHHDRGGLLSPCWSTARRCPPAISPSRR